MSWFLMKLWLILITFVVDSSSFIAYVEKTRVALTFLVKSEECDGAKLQRIKSLFFRHLLKKPQNPSESGILQKLGIPCHKSNNTDLPQLIEQVHFISFIVAQTGILYVFLRIGCVSCSGATTRTETTRPLASFGILEFF